MTKEERLRLEILKEMGVLVIELRTSGRHRVAKCRTAEGKEFSIGLAGSSCCARGLKNFKSDVRRCIAAGGRSWK